MTWCILRTSGGRTLPLLNSLTAAGIEAWTPIETKKRRIPRSKAKREVSAPMMPTFVFASSEHLSQLTSALAQPVNPHPAFSIFRYNGKIALIAAGEIEALRTAERKATPKERQRVFQGGETVRVPEGSFAGMSGIVEQGNGRFTLVCFGGRMRVKVATFLLSGFQ